MTLALGGTTGDISAICIDLVDQPRASLLGASALLDTSQ